MSSTHEWCTRLSEKQLPIIKCRRKDVEEHPLKIITVTERIPKRILGSQSSTGRTTPLTSLPTSLNDIKNALEGIDPLTKFAIEELDPLTQMANQMHSTSQKSLKRQDTMKNELKSWEARRTAILNQFTTSEKLSIVTSFLSDDDQVTIKSKASSSVDKVQHRLEQLDYIDESTQRKFDLSQGEYQRRIDELQKELVQSWNSEQRVKALKIAIQCAKMLSDTDVLQFYPSKFVLLTDILDVFGKLVYERLRTKADYIKPGSSVAMPLPEDFTPDMVPETAKETCRNWFYKIASIRELVPRIYVEMAILKSYSFLTSSEYSAALIRITRMIRGIGNPLVAVYARCYLCRVGLTVTAPGQDNRYLYENFSDFLSTYHHLSSRIVKLELSKQHMDASMYMVLYTPALDFIFQAITVQANDDLLTELCAQCEQIANNSLLLNTIMATFKPTYITARCLHFLDLIRQCDCEGFPIHVLLRTLGLCIGLTSSIAGGNGNGGGGTFIQENRKQILISAWKQIALIKEPANYLNCAEPWVQYTVQYFMAREETNMIFGDVINHLSCDRANEALQKEMQIMLEKILNQNVDMEALLTMENFLPFIDLFKQGPIKVHICKSILNACQHSIATITDPILINTLLYLGNVLHESVNALTFDDEQRQISEIVCSIVRRVNYERDFEQQMTFYVEARGMFCNLYAVLAQLVQCVNLLAVKTRNIVNGHHTRKTGAFVRACAAYCFITIPSISSIQMQLELYLLSGQVALFNNCLGQADAFFKAALTNIPELQSSELVIERGGGGSGGCDTFLLAYIRKFLALLLIVPDSPDKGVLSLIRNLLNVLQHLQWDNAQCLIDVYMNVLDMLAVMAQENYPYYIDKVESNDKLYGSDPKFTAEIDKICTIILNEILNRMKELGGGRSQSLNALKLFAILINRSDFNASNASTQLLINLLQLSVKQGFIDSKYFGRTKEYYMKRCTNNALTLFLSNIK